MTKEEIIAVLGGKPTDESPHVQRPITLDESERLVRSFFQDDKQRAFRDTLVAVRGNAPAGHVLLDSEIGEAIRHSVCLARSARILPPMDSRLYGFVFTRKGYFPCSIHVSMDGLGLATPIGFATNRLTPWNDHLWERGFCTSTVVEKAKSISKLYETISCKDNPFCCFRHEQPEAVATAIISALDSLED